MDLLERKETSQVGTRRKLNEQDVEKQRYRALNK